MQVQKIVKSSAMLLAVGMLPAVSSAALDVTDPSIISLYLLNDQVGSNPFNNAVKPQFYDTAPTGTAQNHDDLQSIASPTWVSTPGIGTGTGLDFERDNLQATRFEGWMSTSQGNYAPGGSFSLMVRLKAESLQDNTFYNVLGTGAHGITLQGSSAPNTGNASFKMRDSSEYWNIDTSGNTNSPNSSGSSVVITTGEWINLFVMYEANANPANSVLTIAVDNGTLFGAQKTVGGAPAGFDSIAEGFDNGNYAWYVGDNSTGTSTFDGMIESIVIWDRALTPTEAASIGFTNVPEPAGLSLVGIGAAALLRRRRPN